MQVAVDYFSITVTYRAKFLVCVKVCFLWFDRVGGGIAVLNTVFATALRTHSLHGAKRDNSPFELLCTCVTVMFINTQLLAKSAHHFCWKRRLGLSAKVLRQTR